MRTRTSPGGAITLYLLHLLIAWPGVWLACFLFALATATIHPIEIFFGNPYFIGFIVAGGAAGFHFNRRHRTWVAALVFLPPLVALVWDAQGWYKMSIDGGWAGVWNNYFGSNCGASECGNEFLLTAPFYATVAYSAGAYWSWRAGRKLEDHPRRLQRSSGALAYPKHLLAGWLGLGLLDTVWILVAAGLTGGPASGAAEGGAFIALYVVVGALAGWLFNRLDRAPVARWVFIPPLVLLPVELVVFSYGPNWPGTWPLLTSPYFLSGPFFAPLVSAAAYSFGAWWALRRSPAPIEQDAA